MVQFVHVFCTNKEYIHTVSAILPYAIFFVSLVVNLGTLLVARREEW